MKKIIKSDIFLGIIASLIFGILFFLAFLKATSPEQWYAGKHDSQCENPMADEGEDCGCYNRFLERERKK